MRIDKSVKDALKVCLWATALVACLLVASGGRDLGEYRQIQITGKTNLRTAAAPWPNATCVSDGWNGTYWNNNDSVCPTIATGSDGNVHAVWQDDTDGPWGNDIEIMYAKWTATGGWSNATCVSDGWGGVNWNSGDSLNPTIALGLDGTVHVAWSDSTVSPWGSDSDILYTNWTAASGWSNASLVSDTWNGGYWNNGFSICPTIAVGSDGTVHLAWWDDTDGSWGIDTEIFYAKWIASGGWSLVTCVSDGWGGAYWNTGTSERPAIAVGVDGTVHLVWQDNTLFQLWGSDPEILHATWTAMGGWSNATCVSDGWGGVYWNKHNSFDPAIAVGLDGSIHSVWYDDTNGPWGNDMEIFHAKWTAVGGWSNASLVSDGRGGVYWNGGNSLNPAIAVEPDGGVLAVWQDDTDGPWGNDMEIFQAKWTAAGGWSNATCVSDGWSGVYWNGGNSLNPAIALGPEGIAHVVWNDETDSLWGSDTEILHAALVVDEAIPVVTIHEPGSSQAFYGTPTYSVAVRDNYGVGGVWCSLDGGTTNASLAGVKTSGAGSVNMSVACSGTIDPALWEAAAVGTVTITVYARDLVGNVASATVVVNKNSPLLTILLVAGCTAGVIVAMFIYIKIIAPRQRSKRNPPST
jgi:hypothetical protein